jgi:hypothetical protein
MDAGLSGLLLAFVVLAAVVILANVAERQTALRPVLFVALLILNFLFVIVFLAAPNVTRTVPSNSTLVAVLALLFGSLASLVLLLPVRRRLARLFPQAHLGERGFDPESMVHLTALVFCIYFVGDRVLEFLVAGGMAGLAENFSAPTVNSLWVQMLIFVLFAALGAGLGTRRRLSDVIQRLGLRAPTVTELGAAALIAFGLYCAVFVISNIWESVTPSEVIKEQTRVSELLSESINTLSMGLLIAGTAAIGEEIIFRGALQPVFGLWPTAIFFALVHIQYTLTPATLIIVLVGVGFGWLRRRYNTTTSMVAHFLYDFGLIALSIYGRYLIDVMRVRP